MRPKAGRGQLRSVTEQRQILDFITIAVGKVPYLSPKATYPHSHNAQRKRSYLTVPYCSTRSAQGTNRKATKVMIRRPLLIGGLTALLTIAITGRADAADENAGPMLPHVGLELTTAFTNSFGPDAESYFKFKSVTPDAITIGYSSSRGVSTTRTLLVSDRQNSSTYVIGFADSMPATIPNTTSLGISAASLLELRNTGQTSLSLAYSADLKTLDGQLSVVEKGIRIPLIIENQSVEVPAIHASGVFGKGNRKASADSILSRQQEQSDDAA